MRKFAAIFLLFCLLYQTFSRSLIVADYWMRQQVYAQRCINKAIPKMHCNGKCQMMKKIRQEENKDQQSPERRSESSRLVLSSKSFFGSLLEPPMNILINQRNRLYSNGSAIDRCFDIFHPPQTTMPS